MLFLLNIINIYMNSTQKKKQKKVPLILNFSMRRFQIYIHFLECTKTQGQHTHNTTSTKFLWLHNIF